MFGKVKKLKQELAVANERIKILEKNIKDQKDLYNNAQEEDINDSTFVIDFNAVNAFSIERLNKGQAVTVIGFIAPNGDTRQWYLYCSHEEHNRLAEEFKKHIKLPKKGRK
jgi:hypothetical protein